MLPKEAIGAFERSFANSSRSPRVRSGVQVQSGMQSIGTYFTAGARCRFERCGCPKEYKPIVVSGDRDG